MGFPSRAPGSAVSQEPHPDLSLLLPAGSGAAAAQLLMRSPPELLQPKQEVFPAPLLLPWAHTGLSGAGTGHHSGQMFSTAYTASFLLLEDAEHMPVAGSAVFSGRWHAWVRRWGRSRAQGKIAFLPCKICPPSSSLPTLPPSFVF